jgi:hypothetical protein
VFSLVDLSDVYMTFFLPTAAAGRVALGTEVRLVLDVAPQYVIPAKASFVADVAQFTPKTVETASEREKLMFRIRAQIPVDLLKKHITQVRPERAALRLDSASHVCSSAGKAAARVHLTPNHTPRQSRGTAEGSRCVSGNYADVITLESAAAWSVSSAPMESESRASFR